MTPDDDYLNTHILPIVKSIKDDVRLTAQIKQWPSDIKASYQHLLLLLEEHGADLRMPHSRSMGNGLFELRAKGKEGIGRAFYCFQVGQRIVVLHSFIKKTQTTPDDELTLARKRLKEVQQHG